MPNYNSHLQSNNIDLQAILNTIDELPEVSNGVELPELSNEGTASDLLSGKQLISSEGEVVTGNMANNGAVTSTMDGINTKSVSIPAGYTSGGTVSLDNTIDNEVDTQTDLIAQIASALEGKVTGSSGGGGAVEYCTVTINVDENAYTYPVYFLVPIAMDGYTIFNIVSGSAVISNAVRNSSMVYFYPEDGRVSFEYTGIGDGTGHMYQQEQYTVMSSPSGMSMVCMAKVLNSSSVTINVY
jgi:hypothetical protein